MYKEEPARELDYIYQDIDEFEIEATKIALEYDKPILGVCRGLQVLNVALGGSLYQDLKYVVFKAVGSRPARTQKRTDLKISL